MAIDRVKKVWLVSPATHAHDIPERLANIGLMHVDEVHDHAGEHADAISRLSTDTRDIEARTRKLNETLDILGDYAKTARDLLSNLIPTPVETTRDELSAALDAIDIDAIHAQAKEHAAAKTAALAAAERAKERLATLGAFRQVQVTVPAQADLRWTQAGLWLAAAKPARRVLDQNLGPEAATLDELATLGGKTLIASVCLTDDGDAVAQRLRELGFEPIASPDTSTALDAYVAAVDTGQTQAAEAIDTAVAKLTELGKSRHQVELVLGYWEEQRETALALGKMAATGRAALLTGYVLEREIDTFRAAVARDLGHVAIIEEEPTEDDNVPVSLTNARFFRPAQFLVEMFGLPGYFKFDPSAYLLISFIVFFGFCLGDAIYGIVMMAMMLPLIKKYRNYPGLRNFFVLLAYCAVTSFIMGVITGTWAADIWKPEYLGENNIFGRIVGFFKLGDPLDKPLIALGAALALGIMNQFWGITMRMYGYWRRGDKLSALFDGGFWFLLLPGIVLLIAWYFSADKPQWLLQAGGLLAVVGALGLVLTQGRNEKSIAGKIVVGLVSLYGIVGSYGAVTFIGDTLSYSRLLALGLTTAIVGMAVNIICGMVGAVPFVGILLFIGFAVGGHIFNLLISGLGAFIHSARLIFVEFFGRFYEPGATRFAPLGAVAGRIRVMD